MSELHPVEAAWRQFRKSHDGLLLKASDEWRDNYLRFVGLKECPAEVPMPSAVPWNLAALAEANARGEEAGTSISAESAWTVNTIHVWAAYRQSKTIYEVELPLADCLRASAWPAETPAAALRLPSLCPVLTIPHQNGVINHVAATYDLLTGAEESGAMELRLSVFAVQTGRWISISVLHLTRPTLAECVEAAAAEARAHGAPDAIRGAMRNDLAGLALTILLYLAGEPDVVRVVHPGEKPLKPKLERSDPERFRDLKEPSTLAVGKVFARAIERWEIEHRSDPGVESGRAVRPHMRRAHSHLYWTGEGRKQPRVRFLLPISVRGGRLVEEPEHPTETTVR